MSITNGLREYVSGPAKSGISHICENAILNIADRIDAEHESACAAAYGSGVMSVPIALDESAWVELPKDADGVPIRIGDVMENIVCPSVHREVTGVGVECFYGFDEGNGRYSQFGANCYRHYHAPTVEDVLREFAEKVTDSQVPGVRPTYEEAISEYAAKLRLANSEE